jgi:hypothetical protein
MLFAKYHRSEIDHFIKSYKVLSKLKTEREWIVKAVTGIISGDKNPKVVMNTLKDKLR